MIRTVPTGDLGLDALLGGGWRLVTRLPGLASATVVVRGGSGAGKTLVGLQVAIELARALDGDIAVACVEILPTEYAAQIRSARSSLEESHVVVMPASVSDRPADVATSTEHPRVYIGLLTDLDPEEPNLVASLETLERDVKRDGGKPAVFIVDSLIEGYSIGANAPRIMADALMKFAAQGGYGLVLCEEQINDAPSPWVFAADTVLQLGVEPRERGRWIEVRKHRFGPSSTDRHELDLSSAVHPEVFPNPSAWASKTVPSILRSHGWAFAQDRRDTSVVFDHPSLSLRQPIQCAFAFVTSSDGSVARNLALALQPTRRVSEFDLVIELDALTHQVEDLVSATFEVRYVPVARGPARALRTLIDRFGATFAKNARQPRRVLIGDLGPVLAAADALDWVEAVRVFATLVIESGSQIPVVAYDGQRSGLSRSVLVAYADVCIDVDVAPDYVAFTMIQRWPRTTERKSINHQTLRNYGKVGPLHALTRDGTTEVW